MIYIRQGGSQLFPGLRNLILRKFDPASGAKSAAMLPPRGQT